MSDQPWYSIPGSKVRPLATDLVHQLERMFPQLADDLAAMPVHRTAMINIVEDHLRNYLKAAG